ncbi:hypothetical protein [Tanticharoenia sakaeratensis]|jgi:hypothetical protein|nr:hypothetical protein [Tanticharoenia sakaeratensis]GBQ19946.1 hypothetical protein AA103193_1208 [Tanticharoenia sakaeratensis NBRC 103193]
MTTLALRTAARQLALLSCAAACLGLSGRAALAQEDDPHDTTQQMTAGVAKVLARDLAVLQVKPDAASQACVSALRDLHKTQDQITYEEKRTKDQDLPVARDVLDSNFEDAMQYCGTDARRLCRTEGDSDPKFAASCGELRRHEDDDDAR